MIFFLPAEYIPYKARNNWAVIIENFSPTSVAPANTLPSNYHFKFIVEEISNVNDKAQVSRLYNWKLHALAQRDIDP